jgi:hypothetical protein
MSATPDWSAYVADLRNRLEVAESALAEWKAVLGRDVPQNDEEECAYNEAWVKAVDSMDAALSARPGEQKE